MQVRSIAKQTLQRMASSRIKQTITTVCLLLLLPFLLAAALPVPDIIVKGKPWYDVRAYSSWATAISSIGATPATVYVVQSTNITADSTPPATMEIVLYGSGGFVISGTKTLNLSNCTVTATARQIFSGAGLVVPPKNPSKLEWFGTAATAITMTVGSEAYLTVESNQAIAASATFPSSTTIQMLGNGRFTVSAGQTLTLNGPFLAPPKQVFFSDGAAIPSMRQPLNASWWPSFARAVADIGTASRTLEVQVPMTISGNLTVPTSAKNLTLAIKQGGSLAPAAATTTTINGPISAGRYQIFIGSGTISGLQETYPEWFGAVSGDSSVDSGSAWQKAVNATIEYGRIVGALAGEYWFTTGVLIQAKPITITGEGPYACIIHADSDIASETALFTVDSCSRAAAADQDDGGYWWQAHSYDNNGVTLSNLILEGGDRIVGKVVHGIECRGKNSDLNFNHLLIANFRGGGILANNPFSTAGGNATQSSVQESRFFEIRIVNSGYNSGTYNTSYAALEIGVGPNGTTNHNHLYLEDVTIGSARWIGTRILNRNAGTPDIQRLKFSRCFWHGTAFLGGPDQHHGEEEHTYNDLIVIGNRTAETENVGRIQVVQFLDCHITGTEPSWYGAYVGGCNAFYGGAVNWIGGSFGAGTTEYGLVFNDANAIGYIGDITCQTEEACWHMVLVNDAYEVVLGPVSSELFAPASVAMCDMAAGKADYIKDLTRKVAFYTKVSSDSLAADVLSPRRTFYHPERLQYPVRAWYLPDDGLTAHDVNYATLSIYNYDSSGVLRLTGDTTTKSVGAGGSGDWQAHIAVPLTLGSTTQLYGLGTVAFGIAKSGTGVIIPSGTVMYETSAWRFP